MAHDIQEVSAENSSGLTNPMIANVTTGVLLGVEGGVTAYLFEQSLERPAFAVAAFAVAAALTVAERYKAGNENSLMKASNIQSPPFADIEFKPLGKEQTRKTSHWDKLGHVAAVGFVLFGGLQLANPQSTIKETTSASEVVIDATANQNNIGTKDGGTRLGDSINGSLTAAEQASLPFTFILDGTKTQVAGTTTPKNAAQEEKVQSSIANMLTSDFQNAAPAQSFVAGIQQAESTATGNVSNVFIIDSSLTSSEKSELANFKKQAHGSTHFYGIVVGEGAASYSIGGESLGSVADPTEFQAALGSKNVMTADSAAQVESDITALDSKSVTKEEKHTTEWPGEAALAFGAALSVLAIRRRLSGFIRKSARK